MSAAALGKLDQLTDQLSAGWTQLDQLSNAMRQVRKLRGELATCDAALEKLTASREDLLTRITAANETVVATVSAVQGLLKTLELPAGVDPTPVKEVIP